MTPQHAAVSRADEVRTAARGWERAGLIDGSTRAAIESAHPPDGRPHAAAWRVVIFVIATVAIVAAFGALASAMRGAGAAMWLFFGAILGVATEYLDRLSLRGNGAAGATSFWAIVAVSAGFGALAEKASSSADEMRFGLLVATLGLALACWRWGIEAYGALGALSFFLLLAQFSGVRVLWAAAALVLLAGMFQLLDRAALPPAHRGAAAGAFGISAIALYAAINRFSLDRHLLEDLRYTDGAAVQPWGLVRAASTAATALVPVVFLVWGLRKRRRLVLDLGLLFAALSLVTLRYYVHLAPLWEVLCASGAALLILALALNRRLRRSPNGEWGGFTARPLYSGMGALPVAAVVAGFAPDARLASPPDTSNFTPGGGVSGGGGAAGSF